MKFSYNWLQNHFEDKLPEAGNLAVKIGLHSFELEEVEEIEIGGKKDWLIDWDILPNRSSDCLCYMGMAKEIGTVLDMKAKMFAVEGVMTSNFDKDLKSSDFISLKIEDESLIKRATKRIAIDVKVGESPQWLKDSLESMGQKSINNVVDITNYVMWVTGQPVHSFDYDKLAGDKNHKNIEIKFAEDGEKITDLSETEHILDSSILVISDGEKSLDIAGIKGGNNSGVDENTTRLMLSAVNFEFENIRNTSKKLKLQTDASKRFENEVPLRKTIIAMEQMSYLLKEFAQAKISDEIIDTNPDYTDNRKIIVKADKINSLLGINLSEDKIGQILERLDFKFTVDSGVFEVEPTEDRLDINIWQDIAEEIGRIYGYENIEEIFPTEGFKIPEINKVKKAIDTVSDVLVEYGFYEVYNRSIVKDGVIKLENSLNANATALRTNLLEKLQDRAIKNLEHIDEPKLFEIGKVFSGLENEKKDRVVNEYYSFAGIIGKRKIKEKQKEDLFFRTKGYLEKVFEALAVKNISWKNSEDKNFIAEIWLRSLASKSGGEEKIGQVGINFWEINIEILAENRDILINYKRISKYPKIERDVAFFVHTEFTVFEAENIIKNVLPREAFDLKLFDIYKDIERERKSFAFRISFQSDEKTLSDQFANEIMEKVYKVLKSKNFEIR